MMTTPPSTAPQDLSQADLAPPSRISSPLWNRLLFIFSLVGLFVAGYLWNLHAHPEDIPCGGSGGCVQVANSPYSQFPPGSGPPVAAYGTVGYLAIVVLSFLRTLPGSRQRDRVLLGLIVAGAALGTLVSLSLTYAELFIIHAICKWCVGSQIIIAALLVFALVDASGRRTLPNPQIVEPS